MNRPIVVGVDPVREDPAPLALASALGELTGARVVAIAVHPVHELPTGLVPPGYDALMRERAEAALRRALQQLPEGADAQAVEGRSVAGTLHGTVCALGAGLLVVGSAHRGRMGRILAGSVADGVLNGAACPVALAPRGYEPPGAITRVGVGLADTIDGRAAMAAAAAIATRAGAVLEVLRAVQPVDWTGVVPPGKAYREAVELARDAAAEAARAAADELAPGVEAIVHAVVESPLAALTKASADLDLLVCGSRGYGPLRRVPLGSVSRPLSHEARCPLVVVPRGTATDVERVFSEDGRVAEA
jgi:nucleotide-binding universal stress UspA family protein